MSDIELCSMDADTLLGQMEQRVEALAPLVGEHGRLTAAIAAMKGDLAPYDRALEKRGRRPGRPRGSKRADEAVALLRQHGPLTIPQIAEHMGIQQNYLYRVLPGLANDGKVVRQTNGTWDLTASHAHDLDGGLA